MSNTNLPPSIGPILRRLADQIDSISNNLPVTQRLSKNNTQALKGVGDSLVQFATPMVRLRDSINRMDETNRKITQMGTTYSKLQASLEKNSNVLDQGIISNRALMTEISKNFEQGIRVNNGAVIDLTKEMVATGQNIEGQRKMNSALLLQTGHNTETVQSLNKTNIEVSDRYGVSNDRLIQSLNSLKSVMDKASFFGPQAVDSFGTIAMELKGRSGGNNIEAGLQALFGIISPGSENIAASRILGAGGSRQKVISGQALSLQDMQPIFANLERIINSSGGEFGLEIASARAQLGPQQVIALKQLIEINKKNFELDDEAKATMAEKSANLKNLEDKAKNFYDNTATAILSTLGGIDTGLLNLGTSLFMLAGGLGTGAGLFAPMTGLNKNASRFERIKYANKRRGRNRFSGMMPKGMMKIGAAGIGAGLAAGAIEDSTGHDMSFTQMGSTIGMAGGLPGVAIGTTVGLLIDIAKNTLGSSEADKESLKMEKEKENRKRAEEASKQLNTLTILTNYTRSRGLMSGAISEDEVMEMRREQNVLLRKMAENKKTVNPSQ